MYDSSHATIKQSHCFSQISTMPEEQTKYKKLINTLAWFFFKLLIFEYVEDSETGMAFRLPGGHQWRLFIEVIQLIMM